MNDHIKLLREWGDSNMNPKDMRDEYEDEFYDILSNMEKDTEPLAVLADRKGIRKIQIWPLLSGVWEIDLELRTRERKEIFVENGYSAAEAKARQYLNGLPDVRGGE